MASGAGLPIEERILQVLQHLGIQQAHFAGRTPRDWTGLATTYPEVFSSLTLVGQFGVATYTVSSLASNLLVVNGDRGPQAESVRSAMEGLPDACLVTLRDYAILGWADVTADRTDEMGSAMLNFLTQKTSPQDARTVTADEEEGDIAGIW